MLIKLICEAQEREADAQLILQMLSKAQVRHDPAASLALVLTATRLELRKQDESKLGAVYVDWVNGAVAHRRKFGGGKGQAIAKAVGLNKGVLPSVLDATAGLGRDAFVLASLGCRVQLLERHPVVFALLADGLQRAQQDKEIGSWVGERLHLLPNKGDDGLMQLVQDPHFVCPDVVYLDPMYPQPEHKKNSALVKKEMRVFHSLVGSDADADALLAPALRLANKRVVVKRPSYAPCLANEPPSMVIETKKNRFDVYVKAAMKAEVAIELS